MAALCGRMPCVGRGGQLERVVQVIELQTPLDLAALQRVSPVRYPLLMSSAAAALEPSAKRNARWDILLCGNGEGLVRDARGGLRDLQGAPLAGGFLDHLQAQWQRQYMPTQAAAHTPFRGGWALFLGYELAQEVEPILRLPMAGDDLPSAVALRCPVGLLHDHASGRTILIAEDHAEAQMAQAHADIAAMQRLGPLPAWQAPLALQEEAPRRYRDSVRRALDYIAAGDVFQVNLSRGWQARFGSAIEPWALHRRLMQANPAPFAGVFAYRDWAVVSASPERLLSIRAHDAQTRPIAGTRPRITGDDHAQRIGELITHPKERAEHVMLVDLERNDLGRVCVPGSVEVDELMGVESYAHVHHIVSNVRGRLRADATPIDAIRAVFPGGTITGCPKVRCMQIIAALEDVRRGAYTGAMGWLNRDGDLDLNILIRSAQLHGDTLRFRTGAGIVADSDPQRELDETRAKARGMLRALGVDHA